MPTTHTPRPVPIIARDAYTGECTGCGARIMLDAQPRPHDCWEAAALAAALGLTA